MPDPGLPATWRHRLGEAAARRRGAAEPLLDIPRQGKALAARVAELTAAADQRCGWEDCKCRSSLGGKPRALCSSDRQSYCCGRIAWAP